MPALGDENLLDNSSFDVDVLGWEPFEGTAPFTSVVFDMDDVDADEMSGSARVTFEDTLAVDTSVFVVQCVRVRQGDSYEGSTSFLIPTGQSRTGSAGMRIFWYDSIDCSGDSSEFGFGNSSSFEGAWADLAPFDFVAPLGTNSAEVGLQIVKPQLGGSLEILFDEVMFVPEPSVLLDGCVAIASAAGLARWRRRRGSRR